MDNDPAKVEYWPKNTPRVFNEMMCTSEDSLRCLVSLLKDEEYQWWMTLISVVPRNRVN